MTEMPQHIADAHKHSSYHREEIVNSTRCGCFYCRGVFSPAEIMLWVDNMSDVGQTALCPRCGIDSVIGDRSGYPITDAFLQEMYDHWF